ncbi:MAG: aspartate carbamoyltransferase catalytic subunit [Firmicutes bacterium]|nr:aspartate carbamoyltransferase catalytic subunit [Bacillota bacterium]
MLNTKDLLGLKGLPAQSIGGLLDAAAVMKKKITGAPKKLGGLTGKSVFLLFYENSTRTSSSFDHAVKILGGNSIGLAVKNSSVQKGETLIDTARTVDSLQADAIVIRHGAGGASALVARSVKASVINAGDGMNEHPTQALLDMLTLKERFGALKGLKVAIIGDVKHSRVARSNIYGLQTMGARVSVAAPRTLLPAGIERMGVTVCRTPKEAASGADAVMGLRLQLERQTGALFPSVAEYSKYFGINDGVMAAAARHAVLLHPGPVNRGVELSSALLDADQSAVDTQVLNGLAVRMALLSILITGKYE